MTFDKERLYMELKARADAYNPMEQPNSTDVFARMIADAFDIVLGDMLVDYHLHTHSSPAGGTTSPPIS